MKKLKKIMIVLLMGLCVIPFLNNNIKAETTTEEYLSEVYTIQPGQEITIPEEVVNLSQYYFENNWIIVDGEHSFNGSSTTKHQFQFFFEHNEIEIYEIDADIMMTSEYLIIEMNDNIIANELLQAINLQFYLPEYTEISYTLDFELDDNLVDESLEFSHNKSNNIYKELDYIFNNFISFDYYLHESSLKLNRTFSKDSNNRFYIYGTNNEDGSAIGLFVSNDNSVEKVISGNPIEDGDPQGNYQLKFTVGISNNFYDLIHDKGFADGVNSIEINESLDIFKAPSIVLDWFLFDGYESEMFYGSKDFDDGFFKDIPTIGNFSTQPHIDMSILAINYNKVIYPGHDRFFPFWYFNNEINQLEFYDSSVKLSRTVDYSSLESINIDDVFNLDPDQIYNHAYDKGIYDGKSIGFEEAKEIFGVFYNGEWITANGFGDIKFEEGYEDGESGGFGLGYDEAKEQFGIYYNNEWLKAVNYGDILFDYGFTDGKEEYGILYNGEWITANAYGDIMFNQGIDYAQNQMPVGHRVEFHIDDQLYFSIDSEDLFVMPPIPTKEDHVFIGWYFKDTEQIFNITNHEFTEDTNLVAKFNTSGSGGLIPAADKPDKKGIIIFSLILVGVLVIASIPVINNFRKKKRK